MKATAEGLCSSDRKTILWCSVCDEVQGRMTTKLEILIVNMRQNEDCEAIEAGGQRLASDFKKECSPIHLIYMFFSNINFLLHLSVVR
jgi:hypothetical protein